MFPTEPSSSTISEMVLLVKWLTPFKYDIPKWTSSRCITVLMESSGFFFKFPISAVTHYHKISSLKTTQIYLTVLEVRISLVCIQGVGRATIFLLEVLGQNVFPGFSKPRVPTFLWLMICLFLHLQSQEGSISSSLTSVILLLHHFLDSTPSLV